LVVGLIVSLLLGLLDSGLGFFGPFFAGHMSAESMPGWLRGMFSGGVNRGVWLLLSSLFVFLVGMFLTTMGAAVPAYIASKMPPVEAMRGEK
jgi:ABC-type antimicrobial peptide transport system permease subunit